MRILLIPGLGEDEFIFDGIKDYLKGDKEFLSLWRLLPEKDVTNLNISRFAKEMVEHFSITPDDVIIGHSLGAWAAVHIKNIVNCHAIQIGGWTDTKKVVAPIPNRRLLYFLVKTGFYLNRVTMAFALLAYRKKPSRELFIRIFKRMQHGNKANLANQFRLVFNPFPNPLTTEPSLRIHAKGDIVVHYPDEPFTEVPGDHFTLYTHPEAVAMPIVNYLNNLKYD